MSEELRGEAARLHARAAGLAAEMVRVQAELIETLALIEDQRVHERLGANSLFGYGCDVLKLGEVLTYGLVTLVRQGRAFPALRTAVAEGLPLSRAVRIGAVMQVDTQAEWIEKARTLSKSALDRAVAEASPEVARREIVRPMRGHRFEVLVNVGDVLMARLRRAQELVGRRAKRTATLEMTLDAMTSLYLEKRDPVSRAARSLGRVNSAAINAVHVRDEDRCQMEKSPGVKCLSSRFTNIHHVVARALGGGDGPENLITLCGSCHRMWHRRHGLGSEVSQSS